MTLWILLVVVGGEKTVNLTPRGIPFEKCDKLARVLNDAQGVQDDLAKSRLFTCRTVGASVADLPPLLR